MSIYQSTYLIPDGSALDFALPQNFSSQVNGSVISFCQDIVRRVDTNAILYDSTKTAVSPALYDKDTLTKTIAGGIITYTGFIKWTRTTWDNLNNSATTREVGFYSYSTPTATLTIISPVASKLVNLTTVYTQLQSVPVQSYQYFLYDSTGTNLLQQSELFCTEKLKYTFDGLLDATSYKSQCIITNKYLQVVDTGKVSFSVDYAQPNISIIPTTTINEDLSAVEIGIGQAIQNIGTSTGTITYIDNYLVVGNTGIQLLNISSTVYWNVNIPTDFTNTFTWQTNGFVSGKIINFEDSLGNYLEIGYTSGAFYLSLNGFIVNGILLTLNSNVYVLGVLNSKVIICQSNIILDIIKPWWIS